MGRTWLRILKSPVIIKEQFGESYCESEAKIKKLKEEIGSLVDDYNKERDEEYFLMRRDPMCKGFRKKQRIVCRRPDPSMYCRAASGMAGGISPNLDRIH